MSKGSPNTALEVDFLRLIIRYDDDDLNEYILIELTLNVLLIVIAPMSSEFNN